MIGEAAFRRVQITSALVMLLISTPTTGAPVEEANSGVPDAVPALFAAPFSVRSDHPLLSTTELIRSYSQLPLHGFVAHRLCRGDEEMRFRLLASLRRRRLDPADQDDRQWLAAHSAVLRACRDEQAACRWMRDQIPQERRGPGLDLLWNRLAACGNPDDLARFERDEAPADALIRYVAAVPRPGVFSERLAALVRQRANAGEVGALGVALAAFARTKDERMARLLLDLLQAEERLGVRRAIGRALIASDDPATAAVGRAVCLRDLAQRIDLSRKKGSPQHFGSPCDRAQTIPFTALGDDTRAEANSRAPATARGIRFSWLDEHATRLRNMTLLVRPDLDDAVFIERLPSVDAIPTSLDDRPTQVFLNGDAAIIPLPSDLANHDPERVEALRSRFEEALADGPVVDAYLAGRRFRLVVHNDHGELIDFANQLLEAVGSDRRMFIDPLGQAIALDHIQ